MLCDQGFTSSLQFTVINSEWLQPVKDLLVSLELSFIPNKLVIFHWSGQIDTHGEYLNFPQGGQGQSCPIMQQAWGKCPLLQFCQCRDKLVVMTPKKAAASFQGQFER